MQVTPRRSGPALIVGQMWIDSASAAVVRLAFRYLGTALWVRPDDGPGGPDSAKARRMNSTVNRLVSVDADLEYGLQEGRYWMPYRQVIAGQVRLPLVSDLVIPFQATTTFEDYIAKGRAVELKIQKDLPMAGLPTLSYLVVRNPRIDLGFEVQGGYAYWRFCKAKIVA